MNRSEEKNMNEHRIVVTTVGVRPKFEEWIADRGGVQVWNNLNLSNHDAGHQFTPALTQVEVPIENGGVNMVPTPQPHWSVGRGEVVTDINRFRFVKSWKEIKRFRVGVRMGSQGMSLKVTDGGTRRIRATQAKFPEAYYHFDYSSQEAVFEIPEYEEG